MNEALLAKKLARVQAKVTVLETLIEDKTLALFLANEDLEKSLEYQREIYRILPESLLVLRTDGTIKAVNPSSMKWGFRISSGCRSLLKSRKRCRTAA